MSCSSPVSWEDLVAYWARDLPPAEVERLDEHLMGCGACSEESARVSALAAALHGFVPPVLSGALLATLRQRGLRIEENTFAPGQRKPVVFAAGVDLLIHRLEGFDLSSARRVKVTISVESTGAVLFQDPDAPFDPREGVLIACQRHFAALPPDTVFEVCAIEASGVERTALYTIPHEFEV